MIYFDITSHIFKYEFNVLSTKGKQIVKAKINFRYLITVIDRQLEKDTYCQLIDVNIVLAPSIGPYLFE